MVEKNGWMDGHQNIKPVSIALLVKVWLKKQNALQI